MQNQISQMTNEEIKIAYRNLSIETSLAQSRYMLAMNTLGKDDAATQTLWAAYLEADEVAQPFRVKMGQISMQEQMQYISKEEWSSIVD